MASSVVFEANSTTTIGLKLVPLMSAGCCIVPSPGSPAAKGEPHISAPTKRYDNFKFNFKQILKH